MTWGLLNLTHRESHERPAPLGPRRRVDGWGLPQHALGVDEPHVGELSFFRVPGGIAGYKGVGGKTTDSLIETFGTTGDVATGRFEVFAFDDEGIANRAAQIQHDPVQELRLLRRAHLGEQFLGLFERSHPIILLHERSAGTQKPQSQPPPDNQNHRSAGSRIAYDLSAALAASSPGAQL